MPIYDNAHECYDNAYEQYDKMAVCTTGKKQRYLQKNQHMKHNFNNIIVGEGKTVIMLYGEVGEGCHVDSNRVVSELFESATQEAPIEVHINSQGGDVFHGIAIYNALKQSKRDIRIYVDGVAASIAAIIALCGKPLYMSPYAKLMLHNVSGGTYGSAKDLRQIANQMDELENSLATMIANRLGMEACDVVKQYFDGEDHWITASEAVEMKLADGIYDMDDTGAEAINLTKAEDIYNYFINRYDNKPLNNLDMALIDDIKTIPGFENKTDSSAVLAHIRELTNKACKADTFEKTVKSYKDELDKLHQAEDARIVDEAIKTGKIGKEQEDTFKNLLQSDRENTIKLIDGMQPRVQQRAVSYIQNAPLGGASFQNKTWKQLDKENRLADLKAQDYDLFCNLYKQEFGIDYIE